MAAFVPRILGWLRDLPDPRDYGVAHATVKELFGGLPRRRSPRARLATALTWEEYLPPVDDQLAAASSAHACVALIEYFSRRTYGRCPRGSSRFLYDMARRLLRASGDSGAALRTTLKALRRFGLPPREFWAETEAGDREPPGFLFSFAREYQPLVYVRLDASGQEGRRTLAAVKSFVAAGLPVAFGFTVFDSLAAEADVPYPTCFDGPLGGQAGVAVGYDDGRRICSEKGALRVRNSWGPHWGDAGHGWLPYRYVLDRLAADFWTVLRPDWLASGEFTSPV